MYYLIFLQSKQESWDCSFLVCKEVHAPLADLVLSSPFFILITCFSLLHDPPSSPLSSSLEHKSTGDDGDGGRCFFNLRNSFHRTVQVGTRGDGSSSANQLTPGPSSFFFCSSFALKSIFSRLHLLRPLERKGMILPQRRAHLLSTRSC